jgi:Peptidase A4 family
MKYYNAVSAKKSLKKSAALGRMGIMLAVLAISLGSGALAQNTASGTNNTPQPSFYPAVPQGFDPVAASDADLATYGLPPRPSLTSTQYTVWVNAVTAAKTRIANPVVQVTNRIHRPIPASPPQAGASRNAAPIANVVTQAFTNWSGAAATGPNNFFTANGSSVTTAFQVPDIGYEDCTFPPYGLSIWAGMDGLADNSTGRNDVLQAGLAVFACPASYSLWYEWWTLGCNSGACYENDIQNFPVNIGDYLYIVVTYNTSSPNGTAYISDQSTGQYISIGFNQPPPINASTAFAGNSAEWVVERPAQGGVLTNLEDYLPTGPYGLYVYTAYNDWALGYGPASAPTGTIYDLEMFCTYATWNPSAACPGGYGLISYPTFGSNQQVFLNVNPEGIAVSQ